MSLTLPLFVIPLHCENSSYNWRVRLRVIVQHGIAKFDMCLSSFQISLPVLLKFDMSCWSTSYLQFRNFKEPIWHGLLNVANQILSSIIDLYY